MSNSNVESNVENSNVESNIEENNSNVEEESNIENEEEFVSNIEEINESNYSETVDEDKFKFHPEIDDPYFYKKLYQKKEFYKYRYEDEKRKMEDICPQTSKSREFRLMPHQEFLKNYISPNTPYNGVLVYHSTGVGKTCTAISIAEGFKDTLKIYGKKIIVISSDAIKKNFKKELYNPAKNRFKKKKDDIVQCTGLTYELGDQFKYLTDEQKLLKIDKLISDSYQFYAYQKFANVLISNIGLDPENLDNITDEQKRKINDIYSNRVIIVDEVHNLRKGGDVKLKKIYKMLEIIIENTSNLKLVFMSATPMYDKPREIIDILNLLLMNDNRKRIRDIEIFDREGNIVKDGEERLLRISKGYVSYLRGENPSTFPLRLVPKEAKIPNVKYDVFGEEIPKDKRLKYEKLILCDMKGLQFRVYHEHLQKRLKKLEDNEEKKEKAVNVLGLAIAQICDIVFPTDTGGGTYGNGGFDAGGIGPFEKFTYMRLEKTYTKFKYRKHAILNIGTKQEVPFLDETVLGDYSAKFKKAFDFIKNCQGTVLLGSMYIAAGVLPFALMLEQNGFERYVIDGETQLLQSQPYPRKPRICYKCGHPYLYKEHTDRKDKNFHTFKVAKYVIVSSGSEGHFKIDIAQAVKMFSSPDNKNGEKVKVFLGTNVIKEGLDFSNIRQMYILDPWYNISDHEQKIGRAIRFCSHVLLKPEQRNVEVFKLATSNKDAEDKKTRETETDDERRYRIAENKDFKIKAVRNILKRSAIDCVPYKKRNLYTDKKKVKQVTSRGEKIDISKDDKPFSVECDYKEECDFKCVWEPHGKLKIDTDTYDLIFDKTDIEKIKKRINKLFKKDIVYEISKIKDFVYKEYPDMEERFIYKALEDLIKGSEYIYDRFDRKGKLIYSGDYYIFEPLELADLKLPMLYREKPLTKKPKRVKLIDFKIEHVEENVNTNSNVNNDSKDMGFVTETIIKINNNFTKYDYLKSHDKSKKNISFNKAIVGIVLDKLDAKMYTIFVKNVLKFYIDKNKSDQFIDKNMDILKIIVDFLDNILIVNGREIKEKGMKKDDIFGFRVNNEYYHYNKKKGRWETCKVYIVRQVENYIKTLKKTIELEDKTKEKNNIVGILSRNKKNDIKFQLIDFDKYKFAKTQKNQKSKRSELSGQVCKTIHASILLSIREKLKLKNTKQKKTRNYVCDEIEIFLRMNSYNNTDNKIWMIDKTL